MTISRKMLLITGTFIATTSMMQARSMKNFDATTLNPYIARAQEALASTEQQLQFEDHGSREILWTGQACAQDLYPQQKSALKVIVKELKHQAKSLKQGDKAFWLPARQLYKAFKHDVYKNWKATFKKNVQKSIEKNDHFAWSWMHRQTITYIQEKQIV